VKQHSLTAIRLPNENRKHCNLCSLNCNHEEASWLPKTPWTLAPLLTRLQAVCHL